MSDCNWISRTFQDSLYIKTWNVAGVKSKLHDINWFRSIANCDLVLIQETWLTEAFFINGFKTVCTNAIPSKAGRASGGLATLIAVSSPLTLKKTFIKAQHYQFLSLTVKGKQDIVVINFYNNIFTTLRHEIISAMEEELIIFVKSAGADCILIWAGNFNIELCKFAPGIQCGYEDDIGDNPSHFPHNNYGEIINNFMYKYNMEIVGINAHEGMGVIHTFEGARPPSSIDPFLISRNCRPLVYKCSIQPSLLSDHHPFLLILKSSIFQTVKASVHASDIKTQGENGISIKWSGVDPTVFSDRIVQKSNLHIATCLDNSSISTDNVLAFLNILTEISKDLKCKPRKKRDYSPRWFNQQCSRLSRDLKAALKVSPRNREDINTLQKLYKQAMNQRKMEIRDNAWENLIRAAETKDSILFWKTLDQPLFKDTQSAKVDTLLRPDDWLTHFESIFNVTQQGNRIVENRSIILLNNIKLDSITHEEIRTALMNSASGKAAGPDRVPIDIFKHNMNFWVPILLKFFNATINGVIPATWAESVIVPIFKKGDRGSASCYRPISLLDSTSKVMGRMMLARLERWTQENNILSIAQYGFRRGIGTIEQCLNLELLIGKYTLARDGFLRLCFVDLSSAFDLVNHSKLWQTLEEMGAPQDIIRFLSQMYAHLSSEIRFGENGECTKHFSITCGIRQGCNLAPLLFSLYINGVDSLLQSLRADAP